MRVDPLPFLDLSSVLASVLMLGCLAQGQPPYPKLDGGCVMMPLLCRRVPPSSLSSPADVVDIGLSRTAGCDSRGVATGCHPRRHS